MIDLTPWKFSISYQGKSRSAYNDRPSSLVFLELPLYLKDKFRKFIAAGNRLLNSLENYWISYRCTIVPKVSNTSFMTQSLGFHRMRYYFGDKVPWASLLFCGVFDPFYSFKDDVSLHVSLKKFTLDFDCIFSLVFFLSFGH